MVKLLLPILLLVFGVAAGAGAGFMLRPTEAATDKAKMEHDAAQAPEKKKADKAHKSKDEHDKDHGGSSEFVKLNNQFVIPVVSGKLVDSLVVMSLSLEVAPGASQDVYSMEPKLRDAFLQVMFDHANIGGFAGAFTDANTLDVLRAELTETAHRIIGEDLLSVLIVDLARQDV